MKTALCSWGLTGCPPGRYLKNRMQLYRKEPLRLYKTPRISFGPASAVNAAFLPRRTVPSPSPPTRPRAPLPAARSFRLLALPKCAPFKPVELRYRDRHRPRGNCPPPPLPNIDPARPRTWPRRPPLTPTNSSSSRPSSMHPRLVSSDASQLRRQPDTTGVGGHAVEPHVLRLAPLVRLAAADGYEGPRRQRPRRRRRPSVARSPRSAASPAIKREPRVAAVVVAGQPPRTRRRGRGAPAGLGSSARRTRKHAAATAVEALAGARPLLVEVGEVGSEGAVLESRPRRGEGVHLRHRGRSSHASPAAETRTSSPVMPGSSWRSGVIQTDDEGVDQTAGRGRRTVRARRPRWATLEVRLLASYLVRLAAADGDLDARRRRPARPPRGRRPRLWSVELGEGRADPQNRARGCRTVRPRESDGRPPRRSSRSVVAPPPHASM